MVRINIYLLKTNVHETFHYSIENSEIKINKQSVFDDDVCLYNEQGIIQHITQLKKEPKKLIKAESQYEIYYRNDKLYTPDWVKFWELSETIKQQTADAVVILNIGRRKLAICHGHSQHLINPYAKEPYFGLWTAVNMIDPKKVNSADVFSPSELSLKKRIKSDVGTEFAYLGINTLNTLLKNIAGHVTQEYQKYIKYLDAADNLKFNYSETPSRLTTILKEFLTIYKLDNYKKTVFSYLDNFIPVKDKSKIEELDCLLVKAINEQSRNLKICTPIDMDHSGAICFSIGSSSSLNCFYEFDIAKILYEKLSNKEITIENINEIKKLKLFIHDQSDVKKTINKFPLYHCLYYERMEEEKWFFLESGVWYHVDKKFSDSIEKEVSDLLTNHLTYNLKFNKYRLRIKYSKDKTDTDKYENWFNKELSTLLKSQGNSVLLDAKTIQMGGYDKVEACDVLFKDKDDNTYLFHNKYDYGSSALSHLFSQGNVSAELLTNPEFRTKLNCKIPDKNLQFAIDDNFNPKDYTVVYGIITKPNAKNTYSIPLFSKINLKIFIDSLRSKSYKYKICFFEEE